MRRVVAVLLFLLVTVIQTQTSEAQNRLTVLSAEEREDDYYLILRRVFHRIYDADVVLSEFFAVGTGIEERATGVLKVANGYEAFALGPSASVWLTEYDRFMRGSTEYCVDDATNKKIECPPRKREKGLPKSYRGIKTTMRTRPLSAELAGRIERAWRQKVSETLRLPAEGGLGGYNHYYSVRSSENEWITVLGSDERENTEVEHMSDFANALTGYAAGVLSERQLKKALKAVETKTTSSTKK